jgi:2'-5' RNA ligase superfamily
VAWFGDTVVWLAPSPAAPFRALTAALTWRFPGTSPYGGVFAEVVPHLSVGHDAPRAVLQAAAVEPHLPNRADVPIRADVACVRLIMGAPEPGAWHALAEFPLG